MRIKLALIFLCLVLGITAQQQRLVYNERFLDHAKELYNWHDVENALSKKLHIPVYKCYEFFSFAFQHKYLSTDDYFQKVSSGALTEKNALAYWLDNIPLYESLYKNEYAGWLAKQGNTPKPMSSCNNLDFSTGNTSGWTAQYNNQGTSGTLNGTQGYGNLTATGFDASGYNDVGYTTELCTAGNDPHVPISRVAPGHPYAMRLGNDSAARIIAQGSSGSLPFQHQLISNTFLVTQNNKTITYWYAVVLCQYNPNNHSATNQPYFKIRMYDQSGSEIICARYDVDALTAQSIGGFSTEVTYVDDGTGTGTLQEYDFFYKDWTQILIPLVNYVGQNVTLTFETSDCAGGGHSGYAYVATDCNALAGIITPSLCTNSTATLTAPPGGASYSWNGPGIVGSSTQPTVSVNQGGGYTVSINTIGNSGFTCNFVLDTIVPYAPTTPTAAFAANTVCVGTATSFTNNSSQDANSFSWNFGDNGTSTGQQPTHTYTQAGTYSVTLISKNPDCSDTMLLPVTVNPQPTAAFSSSTVCLGMPTTFTNSSNPLSNINFNWDFGEPASSSNTSTGQTPTHQYASPGSYTASLNVNNASGCSSSVSHAVQVKPVPSLSLSPGGSFCSYDNVVTSYTSSPASAGLNWTNTNSSIGLGIAGNGLPPNFTAAANTTSSFVTGVITVTPSINGCSGPPASETITIKPTPEVSQPNVNLCAGDVSPAITLSVSPSAGSTVSWTNTSTNNIGLNAASGQGSIPTFTAINNALSMQSNSIYVVPQLNSCYGPPLIFSINVNPRPVPTFTFSQACVGDKTFFDASASSIGSGYISSFLWDMNNDHHYPEATGANPAYTFTTSGNHSVNLMLVSNAGCKDSINEAVYVNASPVISFKADSLSCSPFTTTFTASAVVDAPQNITSWNWNFGNGKTSAQPNTATTTYTNSSHFYNKYYTVELTVVSDIGCSTSVTKTNYITIYPRPKAAFDYSPGYADILDPLIHFQNQSLGVGGPTPYSWDFGDPSSANNQSFAKDTLHSYQYDEDEEKEFIVKLVVSNNYGCKDSITEAVVIHPEVSFFVPNAFTPNGDRRNESFKGYGVGIDNATYDFVIYDRWGLLVFESKDLETGWDGTYKGKIAQEDVYVWKVYFKDIFKKEHDLKGTVSLIK